MSSDSPTPSRRSQRISLADVASALVAPLLLTTLLVFLFVRRDSRPSTPPPTSDGWRRVTLSQKDSAFRPISPARGGASGSVWYRPAGGALQIQFRALGLVPGLHYLMEIDADGTIYSLSSHVADSTGAIAVDTSLTRFAEGVCVGTNYDPPHPIAGRHAVKFWLKRDGSPRSGTQAEFSPGAPEPSLACRGNGDENYAYALLENELAKFEVKP